MLIISSNIYKFTLYQVYGLRLYDFGLLTEKEIYCVNFHNEINGRRKKQ